MENNKENKEETKHNVKYIILCTVFVVLAVMLYMQISYEFGSFYFGPKIKGSITLCTETGNVEYEFEDESGGYGWYEWTVGSDEVPIDIYLFNKNDWQTTRLDFTVTQDDREWLIKGKISSNRFLRRTYEIRVPLDEKIQIIVEFY